MDLYNKLKYFFRYVLLKPRRLKNLILVKTAKMFKSPVVWGMPLTLMLEPTNYCNLKCPLCPTGLGLLNRKKENLSFRNFKKIIDELGLEIIHLRLWNWGEPLLNPEFYRMVKYAKKFNIFVNTSTNSFFLNKENAVKIIDSELDELIISLDGASEETYRKYRKTGSFKKVIEAINLLAKEKEKRNRRFPVIKLQFLIMKHNEHEVSKTIELAKKLKVDELFFKTVGVMNTQVKEDIRKYLPKNPAFSRYLKTGEFKVQRMCDYLWDETTINVDGSVVPCCRDAQNKYVLGNIFKEKFRDIWNNEKYINFRKKVLKNKNKIPLCIGCSGGKKELKIAEIKFR